jgi:NADH-quinone oxidoreductase subunit H
MTSLQSGTGTLSMIGIVESQYAQRSWFVFSGWGLGFIAFVVFAISMIAETNRAPFDLPEAESELVAGFHTEYSGFRWSLFFLAEYTAMIAVSSIAVTLWLGGWLRPFPNALHGSGWELAFSLLPGITFFVIGAVCLWLSIRMPAILRLQKVGFGLFAALIILIGLVMLLPGVRERVQDIYWFAMKVAMFMYLYIWYRATFPRYRFDQLMKIGWKVLLPTSLGVLIMTALWGVLR